MQRDARHCSVAMQHDTWRLRATCNYSAACDAPDSLVLFRTLRPYSPLCPRCSSLLLRCAIFVAAGWRRRACPKRRRRAGPPVLCWSAARPRQTNRRGTLRPLPAQTAARRGAAPTRVLRAHPAALRLSLSADSVLRARALCTTARESRLRSPAAAGPTGPNRSAACNDNASCNTQAADLKWPEDRLFASSGMVVHPQL